MRTAAPPQDLASHRAPARPLVASPTGLAATVVSAAALPACRVAARHEAPLVHRLGAHDARHDLSADERLRTVRPALDRRRRAERRPAGPRRWSSPTSGDGPRGRAAGARLAVESSYRSYSTQASTFAYWVRVSGYAAALRVERAGRPQRAPARDDPRLPELRRVGAVELRGLGRDARPAPGSATTPGGTAS